MKTRTKSIAIHSTPEIIFRQMDDFSKTGMHMTEKSMMMMGSKLHLEQISRNPTGFGSTYRWYGKIMGLTIDFTQTVTKWTPGELKEWQTIGTSRIIIMSWYKMWFNIKQDGENCTTEISISYLPPKEWYFKIVSFLFVRWYCQWCLNSMLYDTKKLVEKENKKVYGASAFYSTQQS
jgi:hypothetical protein